MEIFTFNDMTPEDKQKVVNWGEIDRKIKSFSNNARQETFNVFFKDDGPRLWRHFVVDCKRNFTQFRTYLDKEQFNTR